MRRGLNNEAYTIVEVIIFLAVSSALLVSALLFVGGQQRKTEFYQSIHDIEQQINDIMNNVSTGYYAKTTNFSCIDNVGSLSITDGGGSPSAQGTNKGCVFIGRAIKFGTGGADRSGFIIYNLVGLQNTSGTDIPATSIAEAKPKALAPATTGIYASVPDSSETRTLKYGLTVYSFDFRKGPTIYNNQTAAIAFVSSLGSVVDSKLVSGSQTASLYGIWGDPVPLSTTSRATVDIINNPTSFTNGTESAVICFNSGGTNQSGQITIGSENRQLSTKLEIFNSTNCTP